MNIHTIDLIICILLFLFCFVATLYLYYSDKRTKVGTSSKGLLDSIKYLNK